MGTECAGRTGFKITAYARVADGTRLSKLYTFVHLTKAGLIEVTLTPSYDSDAQTKAHAVYVKVTDSSYTMATNVFCFMVSDTVGEDFCHSICQES